MRRTLLLILLMTAASLMAQPAAQNSAAAPNPQDYSGMYTFLRDGEFVQVTVEDQGHVNGYISRYGDLDSDKGAFLDQFFKQGKLDGRDLTFTTDTVHGVWFEFRGTVDRGEGKNPGDEGYFLLKGTLTQYSSDAGKKTTAKSRDVVFKQFPQGAGTEPEKKD